MANQTRLSPADQSFWFFETDTTSQVIGSLCHLETLPDKTELKTRISELLGHFPKLSKKVTVDRQPMWREDPDFLLERHFKFLHLPEVSSKQELEEEAGRVFSSPLDKRYPLWEILLISNQEHSSKKDSICGLLSRLHHTLADGISGIEVIKFLSSKNAPRISDNLVEAKPGQKIKVFAGLKKIIQEASHAPAKSLFNGKNSSKREILTFDLPLGSIKTIRKAKNCSTNEVALTLVANATKAFHLEKGASFKNPRALIPISLRKWKQRRTFGNYLSALSIKLDAANGCELEAIKKRSQKIKKEGSYYAYALIAKAVANLPPFLQKFFAEFQTKRSHFICTNMPGPAKELFIAGARIEGIYGLPALLVLHGIGFSFISYQDKLCVSLVSDPSIFTEQKRIKELLFEALGELQSAPHNFRSSNLDSNLSLCKGTT